MLRVIDYCSNSLFLKAMDGARLQSNSLSRKESKTCSTLVHFYLIDRCQESTIEIAVELARSMLSRTSRLPI